MASNDQPAATCAHGYREGACSHPFCPHAAPETPVPEHPAAQTRITIGPSSFLAWLGWTWTRSRYGRTIQWP